MRVLLVEDDESTRMLVEEILAARGHEVHSRADAESALQAYAGAPYPLVVSDWLLPGMDGLALCEKIRALPDGGRSIVLMVTARDRADDLRAVLEAGADDYVPKPIDVGALDVRFAVAERQVENLLQRKDAEAKLSQAHGQLARSRDDMRSILNRLDVGTAMADADARLTFVSDAAARMLGTKPDALSGRSWQEAFPIAAKDRRSLAEISRRPPDAREKISAVCELATDERRWLEFEVHDDPRATAGRIFVLYDVSDVHNLRMLLDERAHFQDLVGKSKPMLDVYEQIRRVAEVDATVLIDGETGTGKELVARAIHFESHRKSKPFLTVNTAGLTDSMLASQLFGHKRGAFTGAVEEHKGFFEAAHSGSVFLDEIGDVTESVQTSLLRVLQEREILRLGETKPRKVDVRVIAATHHDLARDVAEGTFRSDLLYRIRVARIHLPPVRERREDVPALASAFLAQSHAATGRAIPGISNEAMARLMSYAWPGNVRELRSALEYATIRCSGDTIEVADLPPEVIANEPGETTVGSGQREDERILQALEEAGGNRSVAARSLGVSRATFYRRLAELGISDKR